MVEDLIEALEVSKSEYEGRGLDFEGNLVKLYSQMRKTISEKYEETDFGPTAVSEPTKSMEEMSKEEFKEHKRTPHFTIKGTMKQPQKKNRNFRHVSCKHSCRSEVSYRSHVITSYFQTGLM